jgi:hypothetical protein
MVADSFVFFLAHSSLFVCPLLFCLPFLQSTLLLFCSYGQTYLKVMKSILEKGSEYVTKESGRLERLLKVGHRLPISTLSLLGGSVEAGHSV